MERTAVIADEHRIVAEGVAVLLDGGGWNVQVEADAAALLRRAGAMQADIVVLGVSTQVHEALTFLRAARAIALALPVVVLSANTEADAIRKAMAEGARGYIAKAASAGDLLRGLEAVRMGLRYVSPGLDMPSCLGHEETLTQRELQIVRLLSEGKRVKQVADELGVSPRTVESHKHAAMQKQGVGTVMGLFLALRANGLLAG